MSYLRNIHRALLGAYGQEDSGVWSGQYKEFIDLSIKAIPYYSGYLQPSPNSTVYFIPIPLNANKVTLTHIANWTSTIGTFAVNKLYSPNQGVTGKLIGMGVSDINNADITGYKFILVCAYSSDGTFSFSK